VVERYGGKLPHTVEALRTLPGIGAYTAAAIASIAFDLDAAALDGNIKRVLARVFDIRHDVRSAQGEKTLRALAESLVPAGRAGDYNQALMDLGATLCAPRAPQCPVCPVRSLCQARRLGVQLERPVTRRRSPLPRRLAAAGVVHQRGRVLIVQRPSEKLLGGLWAFPQCPHQGRRELTAGLQRALREEWSLEVTVGPELPTRVQTFSHYQLSLRVFDCQWVSGSIAGVNCKWVRSSALDHYPMGRGDRQIAFGLQNQAKPTASKQPDVRLRKPRP
jgi:A/G-specific adenine glycosylase